MKMPLHARRVSAARNSTGKSVRFNSAKMIVLEKRHLVSTWDTSVDHHLVEGVRVTVVVEVVLRATDDLVTGTTEKRGTGMKDLVVIDLVTDTIMVEVPRRETEGIVIVNVIGMLDATGDLRTDQLHPKDADAQDLDQPEGDDTHDIYQQNSNNNNQTLKLFN